MVLRELSDLLFHLFESFLVELFLVRLKILRQPQEFPCMHLFLVGCVLEDLLSNIGLMSVPSVQARVEHHLGSYSPFEENVPYREPEYDQPEGDADHPHW